MLQTNSCFNGSIGLEAFPRAVADIVSYVEFNVTVVNRNQRVTVTRRINFVEYTGTEYAVGLIGE